MPRQSLEKPALPLAVADDIELLLQEAEEGYLASPRTSDAACVPPPPTRLTNGQSLAPSPPPAPPRPACFWGFYFVEKGEGSTTARLRDLIQPLLVAVVFPSVVEEEVEAEVQEGLRALAVAEEGRRRSTLLLLPPAAGRRSTLLPPADSAVAEEDGAAAADLPPLQQLLYVCGQPMDPALLPSMDELLSECIDLSRQGSSSGSSSCPSLPFLSLPARTNPAPTSGLPARGAMLRGPPLR